MKKYNRGFSLIELMVVVAIIGILSAIGLPKYQQFKARAVQAEAVSGLGAIYKLNQLYFSTNDGYIVDSAGLEELGFDVTPSQRYTFTVTVPNDSTEGFLAKATSKKILASCSKDFDEWQTDASNKITQVKNGLDGCGNLFGMMKNK